MWRYGSARLPDEHISIIVVMRLDLNRVAHSGRLFLISRLHYSLVTLNQDEPAGDL
jgi:hypothetical protein